LLDASSPALMIFSDLKTILSRNHCIPLNAKLRAAVIAIVDKSVLAKLAPIDFTVLKALPKPVVAY